MSGPQEKPAADGRVKVRLAVVIGALVVLVAGALWLAKRGPAGMPLTCVFHDVTGLNCPGCGMTRATCAVMDGRFYDAFRFNPLGVILLPLAALALVPEVVGWVRGRPPKWRVPIGRRASIALAVLVVAYMVLRNLPWMPFTLLAPGS